MKNLILATLLLVSLFSCNDSNENKGPEAPLLQYTITTAVDTDNNLSLKLLSNKKQLNEGVNTVGFQLEDSSSVVNGGEWKITPIMKMNNGDMMHMHSTPLLGFQSETAGNSGIGQILFVMPTVDHGSWTVEVVYTKDDTDVAKWVFEIMVNPVVFVTTDPTFKTVINVPIANTENKLIMGYNFLAGDPAMGSNTYEIMAFKRIPSMGHGHLESYELLTDLTIKATPFMPSMDHGSSNNTDPVITSEGKYQGVANFTMTGDWQLLLNVVQNGDILLDEEGQTFYFEF